MVEFLSSFRAPASITVATLAHMCGCSVREGGDVYGLVSQVGPIETASHDCLICVTAPEQLSALANTRAGVVICSKDHLSQVPGTAVALVAENPQLSFAKALDLLFPAAQRPQPVLHAGISAAAHIHQSAVIEGDVTIEAGAVVGAGAAIGSGSLIGPNVVIGSHVQIGRNSFVGAAASVFHALLGNNVIVGSGVRIGSNGTEISTGARGNINMPHLGRVVIQDGVRIGANSSVKRGSTRDTLIGEGSRIDDLVTIDQNVVVGRHCIIDAQARVTEGREMEDFQKLGFPSSNSDL